MSDLVFLQIQDDKGCCPVNVRGEGVLKRCILLYGHMHTTIQRFLSLTKENVAVQMILNDRASLAGHGRLSHEAVHLVTQCSP